MRRNHNYFGNHSLALGIKFKCIAIGLNSATLFLLVVSFFHTYFLSFHLPLREHSFYFFLWDEWLECFNSSWLTALIQVVECVTKSLNNKSAHGDIIHTVPFSLHTSEQIFQRTAVVDCSLWIRNSPRLEATYPEKCIYTRKLKSFRIRSIRIQSSHLRFRIRFLSTFTGNYSGFVRTRV